MIIEGKRMGPPLGIRSMAATCDGAVLLVTVHVGEVPRSTDAGLTLRPTIDIESDIHQVYAHPTRPEIVIAAAAVGLCISRDAGATWTIEHQPPTLCGARRGLSTPDRQQRSLQPLGGGMPRWIDGKADTNCIATRDSMAAVIDRSGCLYVSPDDGTTWSCPIDRLPVPSGLHIC